MDLEVVFLVKDRDNFISDADFTFCSSKITLLLLFGWNAALSTVCLSCVSLPITFNFSGSLCFTHVAVKSLRLNFTA